MTTEELIAQADRQLEEWPSAAENFRRLKQVKKRSFTFGDVPLASQFNPARAVSTGAKIDAKSISERPCFLCRINRSADQHVLYNFGEWEILLNPFPIFPVHFTIAHTSHQHQDNIRFSDMSEFVKTFPQLTAFYNGSAAGASCPDHLHFQATLNSEIPLCHYLVDCPGKLIAVEDSTRIYIVDSTPAIALHIVSGDFNEVAERWIGMLLPADEAGMPDKSRRNLFMWKDDEGLLHTLLFLRSKHRPECYTSDAEDCANGRFMVSPGAIDMSGIVITPRKHDFDTLSGYDIARLLNEVSYDFTSSDQLKNLLMR